MASAVTWMENDQCLASVGSMMQCAGHGHSQDSFHAVSRKPPFWTGKKNFLFHFDCLGVITNIFLKKTSFKSWLKCELPFLTQKACY